MELELKHEYAADENEREDTANYFLKEYKSRSKKKFIFRVGPYRDSSLTETIIAYLESKFDIVSIKKLEQKAFFARLDLYIEMHLEPMRVNYENMLRISNALYDLGLAFTNLHLGQISVEPEGYINKDAHQNRLTLGQHIKKKPIVSIYLFITLLYATSLLLGVFISFFIPNNFISRNYIDEINHLIPLFGTALFLPLALFAQQKAIFNKKLGNSLLTRMIKCLIFNIFALFAIFETTASVMQTDINYFLHKRSEKMTKTLQFRIEKVQPGNIRGCRNAISLNGGNFSSIYSRMSSRRLCYVSNEILNQATPGSKIYLTGKTSKFGIFVDSYHL